jgi:hypothetical protein
MKPISACIALCLAAACSACSKPVPVELSHACDQTNEKKYVRVSGFLDDDGSVFCSNPGGRLTCGFELRETAAADRKIGVYIDQGSGANAVEKLASGYGRGDIKIHDNHGRVISLDEKVSLTGRMSVAKDVCFITVDKIEK